MLSLDDGKSVAIIGDLLWTEPQGEHFKKKGRTSDFS